MKKILVCLSLLLMVGCGSTKTEATPTPEVKTASVINVYTRDSSSGTREAFEKAIGLKELTKTAIEVSSNGDMVTKVKTDEHGIGYASISTDFEANGVKPLSFEGVKPTKEAVIDGSYGMQRPFSYVTRSAGDYTSKEQEELVVAFIDFMSNSIEGMMIVEHAGGVVNASKGVAWATLAEKHPIVKKDNSAITITTAGSTSVDKTLKAALEAFVPMAGNFKFVMNQTGSSDGYKRVLGGEKDGVNRADIGFASRKFKDGEEDTTKALLTGAYCLDAVVAIVNPKNNLENLSKDTLSKVYNGEITDFSLCK